MTKKTNVKAKENSNILFIALTGIGNLIMLTPAFANIKKNLPKSKVFVLLLGSSADVVRKNPYVDEVIIYPSKRNLLARFLFLLKLRKRKYDFSFYSYPNVSTMSAVLSFLIGAKYKVNFNYNFLNLKNCSFLNSISVPVDMNKHDIEKNLDLLRACNLRIFTNKMQIYSGKNDEKYVNGILKNKVSKNNVLIGMHVGANEKAKLWHTKNFASLTRKLVMNDKIKIILVGSDIEANLIKNFSEFKHPSVINLIKKLTIPQTTYLIKKCRLFITNDSGPMHMAVAAGTKVLSIFIASNVKRTAPFGKEHVVLLKKYKNYDEDKNKNHIYVNEITPEIVFKQVKKLIYARTK